MIRTPRGALPAVVIVIAIVITACSGQKSAQEPDSASSSPSAGTKAVDTVIDLDTLEKGAAPKIAWLEGGTFHHNDQSIRLPDNESTEVAVLGNRILIRGLARSGGGVELQVLDSTGSITGRYSNPLSRMVTNSKRNIVAWIDEDNTPMVLQDGHKKPLELRREPNGKNGDATAVVGNDCFNGPETVEGAGCSVFYTLARKNRSPPFVSSEHGLVDQVDTKIDELLDVAENGALIGALSASAGKVCGRYENDSTSYETCDHVLDTFSPDAQNIIGYPGLISEGPASDAISVLDALTGKPRLTSRSPAGTYTLWATAWEDDSHVLAVVNQDESTWAIVRVGLDGKAELAAGPKKGDETRPSASPSSPDPRQVRGACGTRGKLGR